MVSKFQSLMRKLDVPADVLDVSALVDSSLTYGESLKLFLEHLAPLVPQNRLMDFQAIQSARIAAYDAEGVKLELEETRKVEAEAIKGIQSAGDAETRARIAASFEPIKLLVKTMAESPDVHACFFYGETGLGKTHAVLEALAERGLEPNQDYLVFAGRVSNLAFYKILYEQRSKKILVFDDVAGMRGFRDDLFMALLKAAMFSVGGARKLNWNTRASILEKEGVPSEFIFDSKVIFLTNSIPESIDFSSVLSRAFAKEVSFSSLQIKELFYALAKSKETAPEQGREVVDFLFEHAGLSEFSECLNLRFLMQALSVRKSSASWQRVLLETMRISPRRLALKQAVESSPIRAEQAHKYVELTGASGRTFFRELARLKLLTK